MSFRIESAHLNGLLVLKTDVFTDDRGFFMETFRTDAFASLGLPTTFAQDNRSRSKKGVLRGLHFQWDPPQGKLVRVAQGVAYLAMADIRRKSPSFGSWFGTEVSADSGTILWVPPGFANGFCAISEVVDIEYKCTTLYNSRAEGSIRWNDPTIDIRWPTGNPIISERDAAGQTLDDWLQKPESHRFEFRA
jgi:dTDP-4-dehydrorhamnose 3,5-epimerase